MSPVRQEEELPSPKPGGGRAREKGEAAGWAPRMDTCGPRMSEQPGHVPRAGAACPAAGSSRGTRCAFVQEQEKPQHLRCADGASLQVQNVPREGTAAGVGRPPPRQVSGVRGRRPAPARLRFASAARSAQRQRRYRAAEHTVLLTRGFMTSDPRAKSGVLRPRGRGQ